MASDHKRLKRREQRARKAAQEKALQVEVEELDTVDNIDEPMEKDYYDSPSSSMDMMGPTSWEEADAMKNAQEEADQVRELTYQTQDLVRSILYVPSMMMSPDEKAKAIKAVGDGLGSRLKAVSPTTMKKELDVDLLELEVFIAKDRRELSMLEKVGDFMSKAKLTASAENALSDSDFALVREEGGKKVRKYPIHDKAHVRNALARAAQQIKEGGAGAADAKAALPAIRAAAKKMGIGDVQKSKSSIIIQKDLSGKWRAVMWPTNNFIDYDGEIISKEAHEEYVDWVNKNMDLAPVFLSWHTPGTQRENKIDFITYENGFILASAPLTEKEAAQLLRVQLTKDLGMSHGSFALERDPNDENIVTKYRTVEYSDLPLEKAANPFTEFSVLMKEAAMKKDEKLAYLSELLGPEEAAKFVEKAGLKQEALREAGVKEKDKETDSEATPEKKDETPKQDAGILTPEQEAAVVALVSKELDIPGLTDTIKDLMEKAKEAEKVPELEAVIKELVRSNDEKLAEKIAPKAMPWSKDVRPSQSKDTLVKEGDNDDDKLLESKPSFWMDELVGTVKA